MDVVNEPYKEPPSIRNICECLKHTEPFSFNFVPQDEVNNYITKVMLINLPEMIKFHQTYYKYQQMFLINP